MAILCIVLFFFFIILPCKNALREITIKGTTDITVKVGMGKVELWMDLSRVLICCCVLPGGLNEF